MVRLRCPAAADRGHCEPVGSAALLLLHERDVLNTNDTSGVSVSVLPNHFPACPGEVPSFIDALALFLSPHVCRSIRAVWMSLRSSFEPAEMTWADLRRLRMTVSYLCDASTVLLLHAIYIRHSWHMLPQTIWHTLPRSEHPLPVHQCFNYCDVFCCLLSCWNPVSSVVCLMICSLCLR